MHSLQLRVSRLEWVQERIRGDKVEGGKVSLLRCFAIKGIREVSSYLEKQVCCQRRDLVGSGF